MTNKAINVTLVVDQLGGDVEAAKYFSISRQAVAKWRKTKVLPRMVKKHLEHVKPEILKAALNTEST